jgi:hypothetical protein
MLFNLSLQRCFPCKEPSKAVTCSSTFGPYFGFGELESREPFNGNSNCISISNLSGYRITDDKEKRNMLTNHKFDIRF